MSRQNGDCLIKEFFQCLAENSADKGGDKVRADRSSDFGRLVDIFVCLIDEILFGLFRSRYGIVCFFADAPATGSVTDIFPLKPTRRISDRECNITGSICQKN